MSMTPRIREQWAKEEVGDAIQDWLKERLEDQTLDFDDREALKKQAVRAMKPVGRRLNSEIHNMIAVGPL